MTSPLIYIEVAIALPVHNTYTYSVPEDLSALATTGKRVLVPFGRRRVTGYILGFCKKIHQEEIKTVLDILDEASLFPSSMIPFFRWIADYYLHPIGDVIKNALPGGLNVFDDHMVSITAKGEEVRAENSVTPLESEILNLLTAAPLRLKELRKKLHQQIPHALMYAMEDRGHIEHTCKLKGGTTKPKVERYVALTDSNMPVDDLSNSRKKILGMIEAQGEIW